MKKKTLLAACAATLMGLSLNAGAQDIMSQVAEGCGPEIDKFCSGVTLGEGRLAACFYAYEDQLSNLCNYTLFEIGNQIEAAAIVLDYFVDACGNDIVNLCSDVEVGDGRIMDCLTSQSTELSVSCSSAIVTVTE